MREVGALIVEAIRQRDDEQAKADPERARARHLRPLPGARPARSSEPVGDRRATGHPRRAWSRGTRQLPADSAGNPLRAAAGRDRRPQRRAARPRSADPAHGRHGRGDRVRRRRCRRNPGQRGLPFRAAASRAVRTPEVFALFVGRRSRRLHRLPRRSPAAQGALAVHRPVRACRASRLPAASASSGCPILSPTVRFTSSTPLS